MCLAAVCSALQVATIYLDKFEESFDKTWFAIVSLLLNSFLAGIHAFQIGLKNGEAEQKETSEVMDDVENRSCHPDDLTQVSS